MSKVDSLGTQRGETSYIAESGSRSAIGSVQWMLEHEKASEKLHHISTDNTIKVLICGQEGFEAIAADIEAAKSSIDIICWGFDPGMALVRNQSNPKYLWAHGEPYGELLKRKALGVEGDGSTGVKVRLLVWYENAGSAVQNSLVGYVDTSYLLVPGNAAGSVTSSTGLITSTWDEGTYLEKTRKNKPLAEQRQDYCIVWWRQATSGQIPNLEVRCRNGIPSKVKPSVADEKDPPSNQGGSHAGNVDEKNLIEEHATHHQKPILIDYDYEGGSKAVGYIMGLNSVTDYWDTAKHLYDDPAREVYLGNAKKAVAANDQGAADALKVKQSISRRPYQDYAARLEGEVLVSVNENFYKAWDSSQLLPKLPATSNRNNTAVLSAALARTSKPDKLAQKRKPVRLQVLRTQPEESYSEQTAKDGTGGKTFAFDKTIKRGYFQATSFARNYLYIENQYFFYAEWARHLKANRQAFMEWTQNAGKTSKDARLLHLLVVMPLPESEGMLPRTYDTFKELGQAQSLAGQQTYLDKRDQSIIYSPDDYLLKHAKSITAPTPTSTLDDTLVQEGKSLGLKVSIYKMVTKHDSKPLYRDIYIHSKLMMTDDSYMTLGSANLNLRSMAADSEINIATDHRATVIELRERVFALQTGGDAVGSGGDGSAKAIADAYDKWKTLGGQNADAIKDGERITGFIVPFTDTRSANYRYG